MIFLPQLPLKVVKNFNLNIILNILCIIHNLQGNLMVIKMGSAGSHENLNQLIATRCLSKQFLLSLNQFLIFLIYFIGLSPKFFLVFCLKRNYCIAIFLRLLSVSLLQIEYLF